MKEEITITDLTKITTEHQVSPSSAQELQTAFMPYFQTAHELAEVAKSVKVTNIGQTSEMGRAKEQFRAVQKVLSETEKTRVEYKAESLQRGRAIDGMAHIIKHILEPVKMHLEAQWKYGERLREAQQAEDRERNTMEAGKYLEFFPKEIDLGTIGEEHFKRYLDIATQMWNARDAAEKKAENERIEQEQKAEQERKAMLAENERLWGERIAWEAEREKERESAAKAQREADAAIAAERAEADKLRREAAEKEQAERERIAAENRAKMEADNAERERLRKEQAEKEAAEKAAQEAPDKEKLLRYCDHILAVEIPKIQSEALNQKLAEAKSLIRRAIQLISEP